MQNQALSHLLTTTLVAIDEHLGATPSDAAGHDVRDAIERYLAGRATTELWGDLETHGRARAELQRSVVDARLAEVDALHKSNLDVGTEQHRGRRAMSGPFTGLAHKARARDQGRDGGRAEVLLAIAEEMQPCTVRQVYYQATVRGIVEKTEAGYAKVQRQLADLRRDGALPWHWIADNTRWQRKPRTWDSLEEALEATARTYRRSLWTDADAYVEVWLEKDALAGVLYPVTQSWDVPLMVSRGYASLSFLYEAAVLHRRRSTGPPILYHFGDFDPSGQDAAAKIESTLRELAPEAEITSRRWRCCRGRSRLAAADPANQGHRQPGQDAGPAAKASSSTPSRPTPCAGSS